MGDEFLEDAQTQFVLLPAMKTTTIYSKPWRLGATGYLLKQTPRGELLAGLQLVHAGGSPMSSNIARKVVQSFRRQKKVAAGFS